MSAIPNGSQHNTIASISHRRLFGRTAQQLRYVHHRRRLDPDRVSLGRRGYCDVPRHRRCVGRTLMAKERSVG